MKVDFHVHSTFSDGLLAPAEVVQRAAANGVELLALTDHDEVAGLEPARAAAESRGVKLVNGVEVSVTWEEASIHIVGLGIDPANETLRAGLASIRRGREERGAAIASALAEIGIHDALEGASRFASNPRLLGRAHFARYLVEQGLVADVRSVFDHYLVRGKPGYVVHRWSLLEQAVLWIRTAGGVPVIAHPSRYRLSNVQLERFFSEFKDVGGEGIEVISGLSAPDQIRTYARVARRFGFLASVASDFHGPGESLADIGALPALPDDLTPVWQSLV